MGDLHRPAPLLAGVAGGAPLSDGRLVDLRSDTVTRPSEAMRRAIAAAEVGDDALGDDPTTRRLEERIAEVLGKERALLFPSGIMANQTALAVLGAWGGEVIVEADAHVLHWEDGAAAALSGLQLRPVPTPDGLLTPGAVEDAVRPDTPYAPRTVAVAVENTHLASGGSVMPVEVAEGIAGVARRHGLPVHLDGARLWNAAAAEGREPSAWAAHADTVMVSLSKGLGAPVGSVLAGPAALMERAWRVRRRLGGAMRQSGLLAAAGLHALDHHLDDLATDHRNADRLAGGMAGIGGFEPLVPSTNIVIFRVEGGPEAADDLLSFLKFRRILMLKFGHRGIRAVTHRDVGSPDIDRVLNVLQAWRSEGPEAS